MRIASIAIVIAAVAVYGLGVARMPPDPRTTGPIVHHEDEVATYGERMAGERGPDERERAAFAWLVRDRPAGSVELATDAERRAELDRRALLRAYDGAPPRIPHPVPERGEPECLACHEDGMRVAGRTAPAMPHATLLSCVQCHVMDAPRAPRGASGLESGPPLTGTFVGAAAPARGPRAWAGAPPGMPHRVRMREDCASCHGTLSTGIGSPHLERLVCTQCHAPSAELDLAPIREGGAE